jgi:cytochrome bd-type quinol oxidase subunit 2
MLGYGISMLGYGISMLGYVSLAIGLCTIYVILVFVITWLYVNDEIRNSSSLREEFNSTVRRVIINIGIFVIPVTAYFLDARKRFVNDAEPYAFVWSACYVVSLLFLLAGLTSLIRDAKREKKTGLYRFRR